MSKLEPGPEWCARPAWLERVDGAAPILLIAPHGGSAGPAARAALHPKVNDLHTAEITRQLARRLGASAFINHGMDRNQIDCNRLSQLTARAPSTLDEIAEGIERAAAKSGNAVVLLIHGWNVIEPRIDFGLGLRTRAHQLRPAGSAFVSASDEFINGPLLRLAELLGPHGVSSTFGLRYPAGGKDNLLQAFTARFAESQFEALRKISKLAAVGVIDAVQLELSVAVRWPGRLRDRCVEIIGDVFSQAQPPAPAGRLPYTVTRTAQTKPAPATRPSAMPLPSRFGIEFCDRDANFGAMASIDVGTGYTGGRIMMLTPSGVVLCTAEGRPELEHDRLALGPLEFRYDGRSVLLSFRGVAIAVPDPHSYVSIERALSLCRLHDYVEVDVRFVPDSRVAAGSPIELAWHNEPGANSSWFGEATAEVSIDGDRRSLTGSGRIGRSFSAVGTGNFVTRKMIWVRLPTMPRLGNIEARAVTYDSGEELSARVFGVQSNSECRLEGLEMPLAYPGGPPTSIEATLEPDSGHSNALRGKVTRFVLLSRPAPDGLRIRTCLGFASFDAGAHAGAGLFEFSTRFGSPTVQESGDEDNND